MSRFSQASCLWPGLRQLWQGAWSGLALAVCFSLALNFTLLTTLVWTELSTPLVRITAWAALALVWTTVAVVTWRRMPRQPTARQLQTAEGLFNLAQSEYLKGNHFAAESALRQILTHNPEDGDAQIMLAGLLRRTARLDDAAAQLAQLEQSEGYGKWWPEVARERQWLADLKQQQSEQQESEQPSETETDAADADRQSTAESHSPIANAA